MFHCSSNVLMIIARNVEATMRVALCECLVFCAAFIVLFFWYSTERYGLVFFWCFVWSVTDMGSYHMCVFCVSVGFGWWVVVLVVGLIILLR